MDSNRKVYLFVTSATLMLLCLSIASQLFDIRLAPIQNISLISELFRDLPKKKEAEKESLRQSFVGDHPVYTSPGKIIDYRSDEIAVSLKPIMEKIYQHKTGKRKRKIRIAYLGDSMIEADLVVGTLRTLMQQEFGGSGVGYVPVKSVSAANRTTVQSKWSGSWDERNFKDKKALDDYFLSGTAFTSNGAALSMVNKVVNDSSAVLEKYILTGRHTNGMVYEADQQSQRAIADKPFNKLLVKADMGISVDFSGSSVGLWIF